MPPGSGRKLAVEWHEFTEYGTKMQCKHCNNIVSKRAVRLKEHLKKCKKNTQSINEETEPEIQIELPPPAKVARTDTFSNSDSPEPSASGIKRTQSSMFSYGIVTTASQKNDLDKNVAKFFYANNIAFNVAQNTEFKKMVQNLRPGYVPPNRNQLAGNLLDDVYNDIEVNLKEELKEATITLILDGWSNIKNDPIFACSIHTGNKSYLFKAVDCGAEKKTSGYCATFAKEAIDEIKKTYEKNVFAICTDNENKMNAMSSILKSSENFPDLLTYGCAAHLLNLCAKEVMPTTLMKQIVEMQKYFKNKHNAHGWLREKGGLMPQIPNDTRWNSQEECLKTFISNFHKYNEIKLEHLDEFDQQIRNLLGNVAIYTEAVYLQSQLKALAKGIDVLQSDNATLSTAVEVWINIIEEPLLNNYAEKFKKRFNHYTEPFHFLAHMTDPKYFGERLINEHEEKAEMWITENHPHFLPGLLKLKIKDKETYPALLFSKNIIEQFPAKKWWNLMKMKTSKMQTLPTDFCDFFIKLHSCPPSSASIERIFSTYGLVWNKIRNRLGAEKAEKLVKVYNFLKCESNDW